MSQLFGPSNPTLDDDDNDRDFVPASLGMRDLPAPPSAEEAFFQLDINRSLDQHGRLARTVAIGFAALAVLYLLAQVFVLKTWPTYIADSIVYVQPTPAKVLPSEGGAPRWPFNGSTYETYIEQQMMNVSRPDVLIGAVHKLNGFERPGESDQLAVDRLVRMLEVTRQGSAYQFSIAAVAGNPAFAAQIANAVTVAYIESASRDERTGDQQRIALLKEERDRIQTALAADRTEQYELNKQLGVASVGAKTPDHYDEDITQILTDLAKARADHDAAASKFTSMDAGHSPSSVAIDAQADEMISSDAGLVSMKLSLNARRVMLIAQMANLTPANPQYKLDEAELTKINGTLEEMMKDLRAKAAERIQLQLRTDLERTGDVEAELNGQLRQLVSTATSATPKMQRSSYLAGDIKRLEARDANVDEELHNVLLEDNAPAAACQVAPAVAPLTRGRSDVLRNTFMIALAGLFFGVLAAVVAHKVDPKIYIAADVERVLGLAPLAQLPNFNEVSEGVAEEYMLRLASAIEHGRKQGSFRNCVFTGIGPGTGVSTLVNRVRAMLEAMGRTTILVDATGARPPVQHSSADPKGADSGSAESALHLVPGGRVARPTALERMAEETETEEDSLVLTDTAPLSVSAETEYLARFVDCAIVVIESGVTTRDALRETAQTLQRLKFGTVGFVLNRVGSAKADAAFRASVEAVETHLRAQGANASRRKERSSPSGLEEPVGENPAPPSATSPRSLFEPEVAAAAATVARFSAPPAQKPGSAPAFCLPSSPMGSTPVARAVKRFSLPFSTELAAESEEPVSVPPIEQPAAPEPPSPASSLTGTAEPAMTKAAPDSLPDSQSDPLPIPADLRSLSQEQEPPAAIANPPVRVAEDKPFAPFPGAAEDVAITAGLPADALCSSHPIAATGASSTSTPVRENPARAIAVRANHPMSATEPKETIQPRSSIADKFAVPKEPPGVAEPPIAPDQVVAPEPAKDTQADPAAVGPASDLPWWLSDAPHNPEPVRPPVLWQPAKMRTSKAAFARPAIGNAPNSQTSAIAGAQKTDSDSDSAPTDRDSRLSGLRNLLFVLGVKNRRSGEESPPQPATSGPKTDPKPIVRTERSIAEDNPPTADAASPRLVTAPPEVLPPRPVVIEFDHLEARPGESSRPDRRPPDDRIATLPSKRGQYKKN
jgi:polysaccharide biosynthesis transport protein